MTELTDESLMKLLQEGRTGALDELYRRYARKIHVFCSIALHSRNSEDLVHDVFLRVIEAAHQFNPKKAPFRTWLFGITRNRGIDLKRREKKRRTVSLDNPGSHGLEDKPSFLETVHSEEPSTEETVLRADLTAAVRSCLGELKKDDEREALVLYYINSKLFREIGEIFGKSTSMAQKLVYAAREKMKSCLEQKKAVP